MAAIPYCAPAVRLCLKSRSGFEQLVSRLTTAGCLDDETGIACFVVLVRPKMLAIESITDFQTEPGLHSALSAGAPGG